MAGQHKRDKPLDGVKKHTRSSDAKEKRRQRDAKRRQTPGVLEKQRLLMAERRAAVKARRRQWDPPKQTKKMTRRILFPPPSAHADVDMDLEPVIASDTLTLAEQFALGVLSEMVAARAGPVFGPVPPPVRYAAWDPTASNSDGASDTRSLAYSSPLSLGSSVQAVHNEPIWKFFAYGTYSDRPLPPYVTQPNSLQKKIWRDLGKIGPLNFIQQQQLKVTKLADSMTKCEWREADHLPSVGVMAPHLGSGKRKRIRLWRRQLEYDISWDEIARREFAEATLAQRA
ncbi:hypothetical protein MSAN_01308600 [Mycena sanguinolenta]|uniref:Uncharacterized protein n=1 Tax=Mycena sanguinolenta TaxID=230812 RepID=A0A8H6YF39_9AGAR|nr:hypothetical protein MSAN_01308600 [Mycena sanguinolenta]